MFGLLDARGNRTYLLDHRTRGFRVTHQTVFVLIDGQATCLDATSDWNHNQPGTSPQEIPEAHNAEHRREHRFKPNQTATVAVQGLLPGPATQALVLDVSGSGMHLHTGAAHAVRSKSQNRAQRHCGRRHHLPMRTRGKRLRYRRRGVGNSTQVSEGIRPPDATPPEILIRDYETADSLHPRDSIVIAFRY